MLTMKKLIVLAALVSGFALTQQAGACEWMKQASKSQTVATCEDGNCPAEQQQTQAEAAAAESAPASAEAIEEPAQPSPTVVASEH